MKLIDLSVILILASYSEGQRWSIDVQRQYVVTNGSDLTIPCKFTYPPEAHNETVTVVAVYWKTSGFRNCSFEDNEKGTFIFHSDEMCMVEKYRKKTKFIGNAASSDCSLQIFDIRDNIPKMYMRIYATNNKNNFSFLKYFVSITVNGTIPATETPAATPGVTPTLMYTSIFVPVAAILIILLVAGIFFWMRHKRSHSLTRKNSGYYANFSRASSDPPKREISDKKDKELPEVKAIDEPVYINLEAPTYEMDQSMDVTDNVYANVDYTK
ncbi:sialoadhesin-like [Amphiprion ocellaris]|uniref:sialoadhesin-like n=1 Tax=Amphiprion ocellaris TaxID=80972 RepID=UPI000C3085C2|nr:sialoadhesin-like [Amphiprion ocellaris]